MLRSIKLIICSEMALITCKECKKDVSTEADACPHCGAKVPKPSGCFKVILVALGLFVLAGIFSSGNKPTTPTVASADAPAAAQRPSAPTAPFVADKDHIPVDWREFSSSKYPEDVRNVAYITKADFWNLCLAWGAGARQHKPSRRFQAIREYLLAHKGVNGVDIMNSGDRVALIGMTTCGVIGSVGRPDGMNVTELPGQRHTQLVYSSRHLYVYVEAPSTEVNGLVTSVQY